jgi:hypothetical protein
VDRLKAQYEEVAVSIDSADAASSLQACEATFATVSATVTQIENDCRIVNELVAATLIEQARERCAAFSEQCSDATSSIRDVVDQISGLLSEHPDCADLQSQLEECKEALKETTAAKIDVESAIDALETAKTASDIAGPEALATAALGLATAARARAIICLATATTATEEASDNKKKGAAGNGDSQTEMVVIDLSDANRIANTKPADEEEVCLVDTVDKVDVSFSFPERAANNVDNDAVDDGNNNDTVPLLVSSFEEAPPHSCCCFNFELPVFLSKLLRFCF